MSRPNESEEWLDELVFSWTEVYKKSMTTLVLLRVVDERGPIATDGIAAELQERTGWGLTERGLYRTLRRLASSGLLATTAEAAARTGVKRKLFTLTGVGQQYLERLNAAAVPG